MLTKIIISVILFIITIISGITLSKTGRPLNVIIFNFHKLIGLAGVVLTGIIIYNLCKNSDISFTLLSMIILSAIFIAALFVSGAFLSFDKPAEIAVLRIHNISMVLGIAGLAASVYILSSRSIQ
jgi:hypothetical protein